MNWNPNWQSAIASIESAGSGNYGAVGPLTKKGNRAYGRYQVMDFNIPSWTKKYLGKELTPDQFLNSPEAQDAVFKGEFGSYVDKYGNPQDAASMWFTGRPAYQGAGRSDVLGTTGADYVSKFNKALKDSGAISAGIASDTMTALGKQPKGILAPQATDDTESRTMTPQDEPRGLLGSLGIQKMEEGAAGETGQRFYERDTFKDTAATLAQGFAAMGSMPGLQKMASDVAAQRSESRSKNKTAQYLRENGMGDMADMLMAGNIGARDVMAAVMKRRLEGPAKLSAKEESIQRLMSTGLSRDVAIGIVDGRLELSRDPITGEATVVDLGAPSPAAAPATAPEGEPVAEDGGTFAGTNVEGATGLKGFLGNAVNTVVDAFGGDQPADKIADAQSKLNLLSTQTTLGMAAEFPGRPSNLTREEVRNLTILPSEITTGPDKALNKAEALLDMVGKQLAAAEAVVNGRYSPQDKSKAQTSIRYLAPLLNDYKSLVSRLSEQRSPDAQQSGQTSVGIRPEVADRLGVYNQ